MGNFTILCNLLCPWTSPSGQIWFTGRENQRFCVHSHTPGPGQDRGSKLLRWKGHSLKGARGLMLHLKSQ